MKQTNVKPADGKLGIIMTGVLMARKGLAKPIGSMTQYDKVRVGKGADKKYLHVGEIVPIANLNDIEFATWDVYPQNAYQAAMYAEVLKEKDINPVRDELEKIVPMKAAFDKNYAKRLDGDNVKDCATRWEMVEALREDIRRLRRRRYTCQSTKRYTTAWPHWSRPCATTTANTSHRVCAMPTQHSRREHRSSWERPTPQWTYLLCGSWQRKPRCR